MLNGGVSGYLTKEEVPDTLVKAVRGVASGEKGWVSQRLAEKLSAWRINPHDPLFLTPRQREVLRLLLGKKNHREIAAELGVTEQTIERHLQMLCEQLGAATLKELISVARQHALV
jgi:DNA-binding NarL/FixJ family response regulator